MLKVYEICVLIFWPAVNVSDYVNCEPSEHSHLHTYRYVVNIPPKPTRKFMDMILKACYWLEPSRLIHTARMVPQENKLRSYVDGPEDMI